MTLTIDFPPELEGLLREEAKRHGQDPAGYVRSIVEARLRPSPIPPARKRSKQEWRQGFLAWVESHRDIDAPVIPLEALRRENLYEDRGL